MTKYYYVLLFFPFLTSSSLANNTCYTPNGEEAQCIPYDDCPITKPGQEFPIDKQFLEDSLCEPYYQDVKYICCGTVSIYHPSLKLLPKRGDCGRQPLQDKIFGGTATGLDEFPWLAHIEYQSNNKSEGHRCGGVIINERYILTAAHCLTGYLYNQIGELYKVRLGEYDTRTNPDCIKHMIGTKEIKECNLPYQDIGYEHFITHSDFSESAKLYDIALIRLSDSIVYNDFVQPICLPMNGEETQPGDTLTVSGWGRTEKSIASKVKLKADLTVVSNSHCNDMYSSLHGIEITDDQICAGGVNATDACSGDSGGPLMRTFPNATDFYVEGIVSFGSSNCSTEGQPGVFSRVSKFIPWILDNMKDF